VHNLLTLVHSENGPLKHVYVYACVGVVCKYYISFENVVSVDLWLATVTVNRGSITKQISLYFGARTCLAWK